LQPPHFAMRVEGCIVMRRSGAILTLILVLRIGTARTADMPPEGMAMPFTLGPGQQIDLPFIRLRPNTCEQISNDFRVTKAPDLGTIIQVNRTLISGKCANHTYNQMTYQAPANVNGTMTDAFEYFQNTNSGPIVIGGLATLCSRPPLGPNSLCP
jgi:hypothetical protein